MALLTNYAYALSYVNFDIDNLDVMYFTTIADRDTYFNLSSLFSGTLKYINFDKKNLLNTTFTIDSSNDDIIKNEFKYNYLIIKEISTGMYYFYFIIGTNYDNKQHLRVTCKLDTFTTFRNYTIPRGVIKRATFREFEKENAYAKYDRGAYTHILTIDDSFKGEKFIQAQKTIQPHVYTYTQSVLDTWLENNVEAWQYIFIDKNHTYKYDKNGSSVNYREPSNFVSNGIYNDYGVLAFPIYKTSNKIIAKYKDITDVNNPIQYEMKTGISAFDVYFRDVNNDSTYIYTMKISKQPPFNVINSGSSIMQLDCSVTDSGDLILDFGSDSAPMDLSINFQAFTQMFTTNLNTIDSLNYSGFFMFEYRYQTSLKYTCNLSLFIQDYIKTNMLISYYKGTTKDIYKYPNAMCNKNIEIRITYNGEIFSIHPSRLDTSNAILELQEAIAPDITKIYVNWKPTNDYIDKNAMANTLTGFIFNDDTSIPIGNSYMAQFLANNKNFYLQRYINTSVNAGMKAGKGYMSGGVGGLAMSIVNSGLDVANLIWEEDNLENRASSLKMANGSALFNNLVKEYGIKCEIWMMTMEELSNICEYYNKYGVNSTQNGFLTDVLGKHKYFDYVEMDVTDIQLVTITGITQEIKNDIVQKLKRGVRFWYSNMYNYSFYNYEVAFDS